MSASMVPPSPETAQMLPPDLRERVQNCSKAIVDVLAWRHPIERIAALSMVESAAFCAVYQATHELPLQLSTERGAA